VLKKRIHIIATVTKIYHKWTHKFGIEVPYKWEDCVRLDNKNDNTLRQDAVRNEMKNVRIAFQVLNGDEAVTPTYQEMHCHMIFDFKMEDFWYKVGFVDDVHTTDTPHVLTYASVVSRELGIISLALATLNYLDVKMADIDNAYLRVPITEKIWTMLGPDLGDGTGKRALVVRVLYCLKSVGATFRIHLDECMPHLGWKPCLVNRDLWMKA
jgi:hypothetical protein